MRDVRWIAMQYDTEEEIPDWDDLYGSADVAVGQALAFQSSFRRQGLPVPRMFLLRCTRTVTYTVEQEEIGD